MIVIHYITRWWFHHQAELPLWAEACKLVIVVQPSSAAEKCFFFLEHSFSHQQRCFLEDNMSLSIMLQYSKFCKDYLKILDFY